jgi:hypothetical protein
MRDRYYIEKQMKIEDEEGNIDYGDPITNLWGSVILSALTNLQEKPERKIKDPVTKKYFTNYWIRERDDAINFFRSEESSFAWICEQMGWNVSAIRNYAEDVISGKKQYQQTTWR